MVVLALKRLKNFDYDKYAQEIYNYVDDEKVQKRGKMIQNGAALGFREIHKNSNYIFIDVFKEYTRNDSIIDEKTGKLKPKDNTNAETKSIIITRQGFVLHEVSTWFHDEDIKVLLLRIFKSRGLHKVAIDDIRDFDLKIMRTFYKYAKRVTELTIQEIGEVAPNPHMPPEDIERSTQDIAKGSKQIQFKSGVRKDLKKSQVVDEGLARRSDIKRVRGKDEDLVTFDINSNGRLIYTLPTEELKRASKMFKIMEKILGVFH